ncbi:MAG TPA: carboxylate--amine ligase [Blastocatellia bacterium]|nr:carboxylate--amine ligase [Blastocatellia bacterium]
MIEDATQLITAVRDKVTGTEQAAAVVFNCHITGLAVARSLGRRRVPVIGLDRDGNGYGLHSRHTTVAGRCPYPPEDEAAFIDLLMRIGEALDRKAVLFPCLDEWVFAVTRHREALEKYYLFPFSDFDTVERILNKNLLYRKCEELGIPIPPTYYVDDLSPEQIASLTSFPCIVKPALQRAFTHEFGEKVFVAETRRELVALCERAARHALLVQEVVGTGVDSFYSLCSFIARDGEPKGVFVGRKLEQYPPDFGTACLVDSRFVESIVERGIEVLKQFNYHGISEVEFLYDQRDGDFKLLDINTRVWKWIGLAIRAGVDLPWLAYADAVYGYVDPAGRQQDGLRWTYLKDYIALRRKTAGAPETTLSRQDWLDLIANQPNGGVIDAVFSRDDPEPFAVMIESLFNERQYYCAC